MKVIITIPAYNEERTIGRVIDEINQIMRQTDYDYQILVVDDGSSDRTVEIAKSREALVYSNSYNLGLAETFRIEIKRCLALGADIIVHTDSDGQYPAKEIPFLIKGVENGYDLVLGSRFKLGSPTRTMPIMNIFGNKAFAKVLSRLTRKKLTDTTTGFRAFNRKVAENISLINTFTYTQEQIIRAIKAGLKVCEIPISIRKTRPSKLFKSPLGYAIRAWINIFRIYRDFDPLKFFGRIGFVFLFFGFLIGLYFIFLHFTIGITGHLGLLFLMIILIFSGMQVILFGFLADMMRK